MVARVHRLIRSLGLGFGLGALLSGAAQAEPKAGERAADVLFERAKAQLRAGDWASACNNFEASMQLDPSVSTQIKLARCREHQKEYLEAFVAYERARELNSSNGKDPARQLELAAAIDAGIAALDAHLARVRVTVSPPAAADAKFEVDGAAPLRDPRDGALLLNPGQVVLRATAEGFLGESLTLTLEASVLREVELQLSPLAAPVAAKGGALAETKPRAEPAAAPSRVKLQQNRSSPSARRVAAYLLGGAGVVALGCAGYFGVRTLSLVGKSRDYCDDNDECTQRGIDLVSDAREAQNTGFVLLAAGGALLGGSVVLVATERAGANRARSAFVAQVSPFHVALTGAF
jgi:hypothetical protein